MKFIAPLVYEAIYLSNAISLGGKTPFNKLGFIKGGIKNGK
jgi:hypothetical protein